VSAPVSAGNQPANKMALPHPQSRKDKQRNEDKPGCRSILWEFVEGAINVTNDGNGKDEVNQAKNRTLSHIETFQSAVCRFVKRLKVCPGQNSLATTGLIDLFRYPGLTFWAKAAAVPRAVSSSGVQVAPLKGVDRHRIKKPARIALRIRRADAANRKTSAHHRQRFGLWEFR
jgi:hypothetical protein